ncbi:MAG: DUF2284 domain-containing protein [candidate division WOR-3 bacterium]
MANTIRKSIKLKGKEGYVSRANKLGIPNAQIIDTKTIVVANWVRLKCQYGCSGYNKYLTCPPFSPAPEYTKKVISEYKTALLLQIDKIPPEKEDQIWQKFKRIIVKLEREIFLDGYYKAFGLSTGPCHFCKKCDITKRCVNPDFARPSMEACGIDVFQTVRNNGWKLEVVKTRQSFCSYVGLILIE